MRVSKPLIGKRLYNHEMALVTLGINHRTAPVELRERVAFTPERMAEAFAELGWVLGVACCALMLPLNQLSGLMVWETIVELHPDALSLADLARRCLGSAAYWATYALVYSFIFMTLGDYLLSLGLCLQLLLPDAALPSYAWSALAAATLLPFCQVRGRLMARLLPFCQAPGLGLGLGSGSGFGNPNPNP